MGGSRRDLLGAARYRRYPGHTWRSHGAARRRVWLVERFAVAINIALFGLIGPFAASLMERVLEINGMLLITKAVVDTARESLVIGEA